MNAFVIILEAFIKATEQIDRDTAWQPREPTWWLEMMEVQKQCMVSLKAIKKAYKLDE